jgi:tyrosyl-tRNA synthetase
MEAGHPVVCLIGGITGLIGDPKATAERVMQEAVIIESNIDFLTKQYKHFLKPTKIVNNMDFYKKMNVASYLRDVGKLMNVNYMLEKDIIARRLETGISYAEFSYTLLQG